MLPLPRLAVGGIQDGADLQPIVWGLMGLLAEQRCQTQHFLARSCFCPHEGSLPITGLASRHLDHWLMSKEMCRELFVRGATGNDLALVEGAYDPVGGAEVRSGGRLEVLCDWLDLPRLVVLDVSRIGDCRLPERPPQIDGLLLDKVTGPSQLFRLQTWLEATWGVPVLGALDEANDARAAINRLPRGQAPCRELCDELARRMAPSTRLADLKSLASRRSLPSLTSSIFPATSERSITIAAAYDAAFHCYYPDTLDLLESLGAKVVDFSPLRDEAPPADADVLYFGCGHPEQFAAELSANQCMLLAVRNAVRAGRRIYAEGGGLAYLCQFVQAEAGDLIPMVGALPAVARFATRPTPPVPVELTLARRCWLGSVGDTLRGYLNSNWLVEPTGAITGHFTEQGHEHNLLGRYQVLASRLHMHFATQPQLLRQFFRAPPAKTNRQPATAAV